MDEVTDVGERREGQTLDDLLREGLLELAQAVEQVEAVILQAGEDLGAPTGQGDVFQVAAEGAAIVEPTRCLEEPGIVELCVVDDEVGHVGRAVVLVGVNDRTVDEVGAVRVAEFQGDDAGSVSAEVALAFGAQFATDVAGERALALVHRSAVEAHVALSAHQSELDRVEDGGFAHPVHADKVRCPLAGDGGIFEEVPVDEPDAG